MSSPAHLRQRRQRDGVSIFFWRASVFGLFGKWFRFCVPVRIQRFSVSECILLRALGTRSVFRRLLTFSHLCLPKQPAVVMCCVPPRQSGLAPFEFWNPKFNPSHGMCSIKTANRVVNSLSLLPQRGSCATDIQLCRWSHAALQYCRAAVPECCSTQPQPYAPS
jgi:hypothetical protein